MKQIAAEVLFRPETDELKFLPEGPCSLGDGRFSWVAIQHGTESKTGSINEWNADTESNQSFPLPGRPGFAFPTDVDHTYVAGVERSLGLFNTSTGDWTVLADNVDAGVDGTIINDAVAFDGNLVFGCKDLKFTDAKAGLYLWRQADRSLIPLRNDQICSNGKVILGSGSNVKLLDIDTPTKQVVEYELDVDGGRLSDSRVVIDLTGDDAFPDGMIATPDGNSVIIAFYNPNDAPHGEARQYSLTSGELEAVWTTEKSPQVTCPQLVNIGGRVRLVLTTAVEHMTPDRQATHTNAGCLFAGDTPFDSVGSQPLFPSTALTVG